MLLLLVIDSFYGGIFMILIFYKGQDKKNIFTSIASTIFAGDTC